MGAVVFHPLTVAKVDRLTEDAVALTFAVPDALRGTYRHRPGQHVTVRAILDGEDVRRSYSICTTPDDETFRIGIRRIEGGRFSTFATGVLRAGDVLEVSPPTGEFVLDPDPTRTGRYGAVAAGSGVTPILSMIATALAVERGSRFTLLLGNRETRSIMFLEELQGLKDRYPDRFHLVHVLSREPSLVPLFAGRIDGPRLGALLALVVDPAIEEWFLCGPLGLVEEARAVLRARGRPDARIHDELFFSGPRPERRPPVEVAGGVPVRFTLDGRSSSVRVDPAGPPILEYALRVRPDTPFSCRGGMCTTCKARVVVGEVRLDRNFALTADDLARGLVLACQAHPVSDELEITFDV